MRKRINTYKVRKTVEEEEYASYITEEDYTQVYDCFSKMSCNINSGTSYKLLFWLLSANVGTVGSIQLDAVVYNEFNKFLISECGPDCAIVRRTFDYCVRELRTAGALTFKARGHYQLNAYGFWRGKVSERKALLHDQHKEGREMFHNPDHNTKLLAESNK